MKKIQAPFQFTEFDQLHELSKDEQNLISVSRQMTNQSYAPYSGFCVGAAVLLENGEIVKGSNQENAAYPSGLCAERVAVFAASALHPGIRIKLFAISARSNHHVVDHPVTPCGACRQVLLEYELKQKQPFHVLLSGETGKIYSINRAQDLLPLSFTSDELNR